MRIRLLLLAAMLLVFCLAKSQYTQFYVLNDSIKPTGFYGELKVSKADIMSDKTIFGLGFSNGSLSIKEMGTSNASATFSFPRNYGMSGTDTTIDAYLISKADGVTTTQAGTKYSSSSANWKSAFVFDSTYKLFITALPDSTDTYYTAYLYEPRKKKWKMIAAYKLQRDGNYLNKLYSFQTGIHPKAKLANVFGISNVWVQTEDKQWHAVDSAKDEELGFIQLSHNPAAPVVDLYQNLDSLLQATKENRIIQAAMDKPIFAASKFKDGIYYKILKEGKGRQVALSDTVTAFYKGYILNGKTFDQTEKEPATFPLNRLIKGWQVGVPACKVGGKIQLIIPSALAYSIRMRGAKIPPNSILVFEIEVLGVK